MELSLEDVPALGAAVRGPGVRGHRRGFSLDARGQRDVVLPILETESKATDISSHTCTECLNYDY